MVTLVIVVSRLNDIVPLVFGPVFLILGVWSFIADEVGAGTVQVIVAAVWIGGGLLRRRSRPA